MNHFGNPAAAVGSAAQRFWHPCYKVRKPLFFHKPYPAAQNGLSWFILKKQ